MSARPNRYSWSRWQGRLSGVAEVHRHPDVSDRVEIALSVDHPARAGLALADRHFSARSRNAGAAISEIRVFYRDGNRPMHRIAAR
ncbi:MAG: hypothetical protein R3D84_17880 [Paracoccaceae bacterium]